MDSTNINNTSGNTLRNKIALYKDIDSQFIHWIKILYDGIKKVPSEEYNMLSSVGGKELFSIYETHGKCVLISYISKDKQDEYMQFICEYLDEHISHGNTTLDQLIDEMCDTCYTIVMSDSSRNMVFKFLELDKVYPSDKIGIWRNMENLKGLSLCVRKCLNVFVNSKINNALIDEFTENTVDEFTEDTVGAFVSNCKCKYKELVSKI